MKISAVIPACNEEDYIKDCLRSLEVAAEAAEVELEKIVVLNRCTDNTEQIALDFGAIIVRENAKNLSKIRNAGVTQASSELVVTVDADSRVSRTMFKSILKSMSSPKNIGGEVIIIPERMSVGIFLTGCMLLPFVLFQRISGGLFFFKKADFKAINGFNEELLSAEDIDFARRLKAHGRRSRKVFKLLPDYIVTSCRKFDRFGDWHFVLSPGKVTSLLKGQNRELADKYWYDFHARE